MAEDDKKISELSESDALQGDELFVFARNGENGAATAARLKEFVFNGLKNQDGGSMPGYYVVPVYDFAYGNKPGIAISGPRNPIQIVPMDYDGSPKTSPADRLILYTKQLGTNTTGLVFANGDMGDKVYLPSTFNRNQLSPSSGEYSKSSTFVTLEWLNSLLGQPRGIPVLDSDGNLPLPEASTDSVGCVKTVEASGMVLPVISIDANGRACLNAYPSMNEAVGTTSKCSTVPLRSILAPSGNGSLMITSTLFVYDERREATADATNLVMERGLYAAIEKAKTEVRGEFLPVVDLGEVAIGSLPDAEPIEIPDGHEKLSKASAVSILLQNGAADGTGDTIDSIRVTCPLKSVSRNQSGELMNVYMGPVFDSDVLSGYSHAGATGQWRICVEITNFYVDGMDAVATVKAIDVTNAGEL